MAHKKGVGSTDNGRDSKSKRLGVKLFGGQEARAGNIIIRQRGTKFHPGENVYMGKDFTLHAAIDGTVSFRKRRYDRTFVSILPLEGNGSTAAPAKPKKEKAPKIVVGETPAVEKAPKKETPKAKAAPVVEEPKKETPKAKAAPVVEEPKKETPKAKAAPVVEEPKKETPKAKAAPVVEEPKKETPKAKAAPVVEEPKKETPKAKAAPVVEEPKKETPKAKAAPVVEEPKKETPKAKAAPVAKGAPEAKAKPKAAKAAKITLPSGKKIKQDDLKVVEGIGPKIEGLLHDGGIKTWQELADAPTEKVQAILDEAGPRYRMHNPATWAKQAKLAAEAKWEALETLQDNLKGGKEVK